MMAATAGARIPTPVGGRDHIEIKPIRSVGAASRIALWALILRDLVVLRKHFVEFVIRTLIQPFLLVFVFLYVFPSIGQGIGGGGGRAAESAFANVLVPGVVGISIMFQGIQAVAMQLATEFGYTREIEDRVQAPCQIWLVAASKVLSGAAQGLVAAVIVFPIAAVVHASGVHAHLTVNWAVVLTLLPLACVTMTSLGLLLGTTFEARNMSLMFGFVVLCIVFANIFGGHRRGGSGWLLPLMILGSGRGGGGWGGGGGGGGGFSGGGGSFGGGGSSGSW